MSSLLVGFCTTTPPALPTTLLYSPLPTLPAILSLNCLHYPVILLPYPCPRSSSPHPSSSVRSLQCQVARGSATGTSHASTSHPSPMNCLNTPLASPPSSAPRVLWPLQPTHLESLPWKSLEQSSTRLGSAKTTKISTVNIKVPAICCGHSVL